MMDLIKSQKLDEGETSAQGSGLEEEDVVQGSIPTIMPHCEGTAGETGNGPCREGLQSPCRGLQSPRG